MKKTFLLLLTLWLTMAAGAQDWRATVPYHYGFEDATENAAWMLLNVDSLPNQWFIGSATNNGGTQSLYITNDTGLNNNYVDTSAVSVIAYRDFTLEAGFYSIGFDWRSVGERYYDILISVLVPESADSLLRSGVSLPNGVSVWSGLPDDWINLGPANGFGLSNATGWTSQNAYFDVPTTGNYRLAFIWTNDAGSGTNPPAAIDNINFRRVTCLQPTQLSCLQDIDAVTLSWTAGSSETNWLVVGNDTSYLSNSNTISVGGLMPRTTYTFQVYALCDDGDTSLPATITCATGITIPYAENFEDSAYNGMDYIPGWSYLMTGDSAHSAGAYLPMLYGSDGDHMLRLRGFGYAIMPLVDTPVDTLQLSFNHTVSSADSPLEVGVMEGSIFVPLATLNDPVGTSHKTLYLLNYAGTGRHIAFRNYSNDADAVSKTHYIDDIVLDYLPSCYPVAQTIPTPDSTSATVVWTPQINGNAWLVQLLDDSDSVVASVHTTDTVHTFTSLAPQSDYHYTVRTLCGDNDTSTAFAGSFRTKCVAVTNAELPYFYGFEDDNLGYCWHGYGSGYNVPTTSWNGANSGNYGLSFSANADDYSYLVLPLFEAPVNTLMVSLYMRAATRNREATMVIGVMDDPDDLTSFQGVDTVSSSSTDMDFFELPLTNYNGTGRNIAILCDSGALNSFYIDDVTVELTPSCSKVRNLDVPIVTAGAALVRWTNGRIGNYVGATVEVRDTTSDTWQSVTTSTMESLVTNLNHNIAYDVRVAAMCEGGDMSQYMHTLITTAMTACNTIDSLSMRNDTLMGFSTSNHFELPVHNWHPYSFTEQLFTASELDTAGSVSAIEFFYSDTLHTMTAKDSCKIYMGISDGTTISGRNFVDPSQMTLVYSGPLNCSYGWNTFAFNEGFFNYDGRHSLVIAVVDNSGDSHDDSYRFACHSASGKAITLYSNEYTFDNYMLMDYLDLPYRNNMVLHFADCGTESECYPPMIFTENIGTDQVSVSLIPGAYETSWSLYAQAMGDEMTYVGTTQQHSYTFHNLMPSTTYTLRIMGECEDSAYSDVVVTTKCLAQPVPFTEDFSSWPVSASPIVPSCWYKYYTLGANIPYVTQFEAHSDGNSLFLFSTASSYSLVALPQLEPSVDSLQINFWLYREYNSGNNNNSDHRMVVGVMSDVEDIATFVTIDTIVSPVVNSWHYFEVPLNSFMDDTLLTTDQKEALRHGRIVLLSPDSSYSYPYIDDIEVDYIPRCPHPTGLRHVANNASDTLVVSWDFSSNNLGYFVGDGTNEYFTTDTFYYLPNLNGSMMYEVSVRQYCGATDNAGLIIWSDTSRPATANYRTNCGPITRTPWIEGFEGNSARGAFDTIFAHCWNRINNAPNYMGIPQISSQDGYYSDIHSGTRGVNWEAGTSQMYGDYQYIISPRIDTALLPINQLQVNFWAKAMRSSMTPVFKVGVMDDSESIDSFEPVDTITIQGITGWRKYTIYLNNYTGNGTHIALKADRPETDWEASIDDIVIDLMPSCPPVSNIAVVNADTSLISLTWTENGTATMWDVEYGPQGFVPGSGDGTLSTAVSLPFTATGLATNTRYDFYIRPLCSDPVEPVRATFSTSGAYVTLPFYCAFDNDSQNGYWEFSNGSNINAWHIGHATGHLDSNALYISDNGGTAYHYDADSTCVSYAWVNVKFPEAGNYNYSYDWKCQGQDAYVFDFLRAAFVPVSVVPQGSQYIVPGFHVNTLPQGWIAIDGGSMLNRDTTWTTVRSEVSITTPGIYRMMFIWYNDRIGVGHNPPAAIDNVIIRQTTCQIPTALQYTAYDDSIALAWTPAGDESQWVVSCEDTSYVCSTPYTTITGLMANTTYHVQVRSYCFIGDTSLATTATIHTECHPLAVPYYENFDAITTSTTALTGVVMPCWHFTPTLSYGSDETGLEPTVYYGSSLAQSGNYSLRFKGVGYITLPPVDLPLNRVKISLAHFTNDASNTFEIGVWENDQFLSFATVSDQAGSYVTHTVAFNNYQGSSRTIAFKVVDPEPDGYFHNSIQFIDDIAIEELPDCMPVVNPHSNFVSTTEINLNWTDATPAVGWIVAYGPAGVDIDSATTLYTTSHPVNIANLDTLTSYDFYVRPVCSEDTAAWTGPVTIATSYCDSAFTVATGSGIGTGTSYYMPLNNLYEYSVTEVIITAGEMTGVGEIESIAFYYNHTTPMTGKDNVDIYLQPTNKSQFTANADMVALDSTGVLVYSGNLNCSQGWNYFNLQTPYNWNGVDNVLVIIDDNSGASNTTMSTFRTASSQGYKTITHYSATDNPNPSQPNQYYVQKSRYAHRPMMQLISCGTNPCPDPYNLSVTNVKVDSATFHWRGNGNTYEVACKRVADTEWPVAQEVTVGGVNGSYVFAGLDEHTDYLCRVRQNCGDGMTSEWVIDSFTTAFRPCPAVTDVVVSQVSYSSAMVDWSSENEDAVWQVHVWSNVIDTVVQTATHPVLVDGLNPNVDYSLQVSTVCNYSGLVSDVSAVVTFATLVCDSVTGVELADITSTTAVLSWNATGTGNYTVEYGPVGFAENTGTRVTDIAASPYTLTGLEPETEYDVYVRSECAPGVSSHWSRRITFTTTHQGIAPAGALNFHIFPNPTSTTASVAISGVNGDVNVTLVDINGRIVVSDAMHCDGDCVKHIVVDALPKGTYFVHVAGNDINAVRKLVVQ